LIEDTDILQKLPRSSSELLLKIKNSSKNFNAIYFIMCLDRVTNKKKVILETVRSLKDMNLDPSIMIAEKVFPKGPFEKNGAQRFIDAAKEGDLVTIE
jgi:hypothetical protein